MVISSTNNNNIIIIIVITIIQNEKRKNLGKEEKKTKEKLLTKIFCFKIILRLFLATMDFCMCFSLKNKTNAWIKIGDTFPAIWSSSSSSKRMVNTMLSSYYQFTLWLILMHRKKFLWKQTIKISCTSSLSTQNNTSFHLLFVCLFVFHSVSSLNEWKVFHFISFQNKIKNIIVCLDDMSPSPSFILSPHTNHEEFFSLPQKHQMNKSLSLLTVS